MYNIGIIIIGIYLYNLTLLLYSFDCFSFQLQCL